jgi:hypothetical protein
MTAEPTRERGADETSATPNEHAPTFQTEASAAAAVTAEAVAQVVAAAAAARAAAAEEAAAEAAAAETAAEETAAEETAAPSMAADVGAGGEALTAATTDMVAITDVAAATDVAATTGVAATADVPATPPADPVMAAIAAAPAAPPDVAAPPAVASPAAIATPEAATAAVPDATPKPSRRPVILAWTRRLVIFVVSVVFLVAGVMLGATTFQRTRPAPTGAGAIVSTQSPADVAKEFISALAVGDADAIRSSLSQQPNKDLTDEFTKFGIKKVTGVETLGTAVDGQRSATEVLLHTVDTTGNTFDINLIILVNGNTIEGFR